MRLFDTSVVIDCRDTSSPWHDWAVEQLASAVHEGGAGLNTVALAEASVRAVDRDRLAPALEEIGFTLLPLPVSAATPAAAVFAAYLKRCHRAGVARASRIPLPDFLIGAHASSEAMQLVTRDPGRVKTYFPDVEIVSPPQQDR